jgi:ferritin
MLNEKIQTAFNDQINAELASAYIYLSMAAWFNSKNLSGIARWLQVQAQEEVEHAMKFFHFIDERLGQVELKAIEGPRIDWDSPLDAFENVLGHEQYITERINSLVDLAKAENDHASLGFLQWFVKEQVEEEANADKVVQQMRMIKDSPNGLFMIDHYMGKRGAD